MYASEDIVVWLTLVFGCIRWAETTNGSQPMTPSQIRKTLLQGYNRADLPPHGPTTVALGIYVHSFYDIDERNMDYSMGIYFRQQWVDPRLAFGRLFEQKRLRRVKLEDGSWRKLWVPDVYFRNEKSAAYHEVTTPNRMMFLQSNGEIWYASKISASLSCPMYLQRFPLDTQICPMLFESYGYTADDIVLEWLPSPVQFDPDIHLPRYSLVDIFLTDCTKNYTTGLYPCLKITFKLKRDIGYYLIQLYLPSGLVVVLSWIAFWSSIHAGLERISIGLLAVLTVTTHSASSRDHLPEVSYITAMDVWMSACLLFGVASLLESAVVNALQGEAKTVQQPRPPSNREGQTAFENKDMPNGSHGNNELNVDLPDEEPPGNRKARFIDKVSRRIFPIIFVVFCIIYWTAYLYL